MSKHWCYTLRKVLAEVFVDEESDLDPGVAVSLSNLGGQVCKTRQEDSVEMTVFRLFESLMLNWKYSSDTANIPFFIFHWLLKDEMIFIENWAQCCLLILLILLIAFI